MTGELERVLAELAALRLRVRELEEQRLPMESARVRPPAGVQVVRTNGVVDGAAGSDPPRYWKGKRQVVDGTGTADSAFGVTGIVRTLHSPLLQRYSHDVAVVEVDHFQCLLPVPAQLVPVYVSATSGGPFGAKGKYADIDVSGGVPAPAGFAAELPMLNANSHSLFWGTAPPYTLGAVLPGLHVWPLTDAGGASTMTGVDKDLGFFIVFTMPPGPTAHTFTKAIVVGADTLTVVVKVDAQGNVTDVDFTKT